jgi:hypothetical protein
MSRFFWQNHSSERSSEPETPEKPLPEKDLGEKKLSCSVHVSKREEL